MAITWKSIAAPNMGTSVTGLAQASNAFDKAISGLTGLAADQREMNIYGQEQARLAETQSGREALLAATKTSEDWQNADLGALLEGYDDPRVRASLTDAFNKRIGELQTIEKGALDITGKEISNTNAVADQILQEEAHDQTLAMNAQTMALKDTAEARTATKHDWDVEDRFIKKNDEVLTGELNQMIWEAQTKGVPESDIQVMVESFLQQTDEDGKPVIRAGLVKQLTTEAKNRSLEYNSLTPDEQAAVSAASAQIDSKYAKAGIGMTTDKRTGNLVPAPGLNALNAAKTQYDETIKAYEVLRQPVLEAAQNHGNIGNYINKNIKVKNAEAVAEVKEIQSDVAGIVFKNIKQQLTTGPNAMEPAMVDKLLSKYKGKIPEDLALAVLQGEAITKDTLDIGEQDTAFGSPIIFSHDLSGFESNLETRGFDYIMSDIRATQAKIHRQGVDTQIATIGKAAAKEKEQIRLGVRNRTEDLKKLRGY